MSGDAERHETELKEVTTHEQSCEGGGDNEEASARNRCMKLVTQHVKKLLAVVLLIILVLVVTALKKQMILRSDWEADFNYTKASLMALTKFDGNVFDGSHLNNLFNGIAESDSMFVDDNERISALNLSNVIRNGWGKAEGELYYHKFSHQVTYFQAQEYCQRWTGRMAAGILRDKSTIRYISGSPAWVGYNELGGKWGWIDGGVTNNTLVHVDEQSMTMQNGSQLACGFTEKSSTDRRLLLKTSTCYATMSYICEVEMNYAYR